MVEKKNIAIFASGGGSNARKILEHFKGSETGHVALIVCNKPDAGVIDIAREFNVPVQMINRQLFYESHDLLDILRFHQIDFIALAGFLWLMPPYLVQAYPKKMINIHPALLPKFGGKGMFGHHVHEAVKAAGELESGPTIHYVNEHYDEGDIIFQTSTPIAPDDTPEMIAHKVLQLEHRYYPVVIEECL